MDLLTKEAIPHGPGAAGAQHRPETANVRNVWKQVFYGKVSGQFQIFLSHTRSSESKDGRKSKAEKKNGVSTPERHQKTIYGES